MPKSVKEYSYEELLDRVLARLPRKQFKPGHFEVPRAEVINVGNKTVIRNFKSMSEYLNREPKLLMKYFIKELAVPGSFDEASGSLTLQGRFSAMILNKLIERFVKLYVICPTCGSHYTELVREGKVFKLKCLACGAETTLKAF